MAETLTLTPIFHMVEILRRRRKWILLLAGAGISSYGVYRLYHHPPIAKRRSKMYNLLKALISVAEAVSSSSETVTLLSSDLNSFLRSDSDEIPTSLKQLSKIVSSEEFSVLVSRFSEALTLGTVRGIGSGSDSSPSSSSDFSDRILEKVFSPSGSGFASAVVGSFARNILIGYNTRTTSAHQDSQSPEIPSWMVMISSDSKCKELVADCIEKFVGTFVAVFLEKTMDINTYDQFFTGVTNPRHEAKVKELFVSICNGAVDTAVRTSHQVITGSNQEKDQKNSPEENVGSSSNVTEKGENGWLDMVSTTLAVPINRNLVLDVTGRVTFETVRSFLEFFLWKVYDSTKRGARAVGDGVVERGMDVVRYCSAKSMLVVTICLALCMRVMVGARVLMPA